LAGPRLAELPGVVARPRGQLWEVHVLPLAEDAQPWAVERQPDRDSRTVRAVARFQPSRQLWAVELVGTTTIVELAIEG
tara:strand:+ start:47661 stop:47897 length:237 start_codon:yes stop_codon:yes gene_type:complete